MHKLAALCVRRPVFATMLIGALVVVGLFSLGTLGLDLFPKVDVPTVLVTVSDPGASAREVETEITKPIEDAVNTISKIDDIHSTSSEGLSQVIIEFKLDKNGDTATQEVQSKVNALIASLPSSAKTPIVLKFDPDAQPILQVAVSAPRPVKEVTDIADRLVKRAIENAPGVGEVTLVGGQKREIQVLVDPAKLQALNLSVSQVALALQQQNLQLPGGTVNQGARAFTLRTMGLLKHASDFEQLVVANHDGYPVRLKDIGRVIDGQAQPETASLLDGQPTVALLVLKQSGANSVDASRGVRQRLAQLAPTLPKDVHLQVIGDQSVFIEASLSKIKEHLIVGSFLAALVILIFLSNWRTTVIAALAIPTSIISTFALMNAMGYTLNVVTMLALTLMVGIVIDDAIIVLENIFRFIEEKGMPPFTAAVEATKEIGLPVMATTLSLLAVFLPIGFMGGIVGRFMSAFGFTASFAIAVSLLVSFTLTPMLAARMLRRDPSGPDHHDSKQTPVFAWIDHHYTRLLEWSLAHRRRVVLFCGLAILAIVPLFMFVGKNFLPTDDRSEFTVQVKMAVGTSLAATTLQAERMAAAIRQLPGVEHTLTVTGNGPDKAQYKGSIDVILVPPHDRSLGQQALMLQTRDMLHKDFSDVTVSVQKISEVGGNQDNSDVQYALSGPDLNRLDHYATDVLAKLRKVPDVVDADTSIASGNPEMRVVIDRQRAADLGVTVQDISAAISALVSGQTVSTFNANGEQYDVRLRAIAAARSGVNALRQIPVAVTPSGVVTLDQVAEVVPATGPASITRLNRQRTVTLFANVLPGGSQAAVLNALDQAVAQEHMAPGYAPALTGASKELRRTGYYFGLAFLLTFIFIYIVLAAQFESFLHPVTILLTLPLAVPFGLVSLLIAHQTVNIFTGLGLLVLFGIVKKNAILQIDHTNNLRAQGLERHAALMQANRDRLRPILMTTIALVAGMLPLVVEGGTGSATNRSIGVLVVGGQSLCLMLTLLAVPVFYSVFDDLRLRTGELSATWRTRFGKRPADEVVAAD